MLRISIDTILVHFFLPEQFIRQSQVDKHQKSFFQTDQLQNGKAVWLEITKQKTKDKSSDIFQGGLI